MNTSEIVNRMSAPGCVSTDKCVLFQRLSLSKPLYCCVFVRTPSRLTAVTADTEHGLRGRRTTAYPKVRTMGRSLVALEMHGPRRLHLGHIEHANVSIASNAFVMKISDCDTVGRGCGFITFAMHSNGSSLCSLIRSV